MEEVRQATTADMPGVRDLCRSYRDLLLARNADDPAIVKTYYAEETYEALLGDLPRLHAPPNGAIFVGEVAENLVACGMTHRIDAETCEIKRVFVTEAARGLGVATSIFAAAMKQAKADGYRRMVLDTMATLTEAIQLYGRLGFAPCAPFYGVDPRFVGQILFFDRAL